MSVEARLDDGRILGDFDRLVEQGILVFTTGYKSVSTWVNGFSFEFRILPSIAQKPMYAVDDRKPANTEPPTVSTVPGLRPGSDINTKGYEIAAVGTTHLFTFNKFPGARPHMLLLTKDGYRRQHEPLDRDDLGALWSVRVKLNNKSIIHKRYLTFYNCGFDSGCSRLHKHMQIFPATEYIPFDLWPDKNDEELRKITIPFKYAIHRFEKGWEATSNNLLEIYQRLLRQAEDDLMPYTTKAKASSSVENASSSAVIPHNVIIDRHWMVVIPRRAAGWDGVTGNAAAMLGIICVPTEEKMQEWYLRGPCNVLARLGVPAVEDQE